jgi:hypothetical protein
MSFFGVDADELPKADVRLKEGDRVFDMDLVVLETPGHTPGSVCLYAEKEGILFSGDTIFFDGVGRSDLSGGSEKKLRESIQKKIAVLPPETRVFPGHGPFTSVEREKRGNIYLKGMPQVPVTVVQRSPLIAQRQAAAAAAQKALEAAPRSASTGKKPPGSPSAARKLAGKKSAVPGKKLLRKRFPPKPGRTAISLPARSAKTAKKRPAGQDRARRPTAKPVRGKGPVAVKKGSASRPPRRKPAQATRSTKAPGAGRKPPR